MFHGSTSLSSFEPNESGQLRDVQLDIKAGQKKSFHGLKNLIISDF